MKSLISCALLFLSLSGKSQIMRFKAVQFICTRFQNQAMDPPEFKDLDSLKVEWDMDSTILHIHTHTEQRYTLNRNPISSENTDSMVVTKFNGIDRLGVSCSVTMVIYKLDKFPHLALIGIEYPDKTYMYYVEKG